MELSIFIPIFASENNRDMSIKDKLFRILAEQDLYKQGESDTINSERYEGTKYKITFNNGWWDLEKYKGETCTHKICFMQLSKLVREIINYEKIDY